jgi:hypothetical protein
MARRLTKVVLLKELLEINEKYSSDIEVAHRMRDVLLLKYINDPKITEAFEAEGNWYA